MYGIFVAFSRLPRVAEVQEEETDRNEDKRGDRKRHRCTEVYKDRESMTEKTEMKINSGKEREIE